MDRRPASRISVQKGSDFQILTTNESDSARVGSFSQFGPSSPVSEKIRVLMTPHSGFSMNRTEMIVGIDGTAQGSTNRTASTFTHQRLCVKKPDRKSAITIFTLIATTRNTSVLTAVRRNTGSWPTPTYSAGPRPTQKPYPPRNPPKPSHPPTSPPPNT